MYVVCWSIAGDRINDDDLIDTWRLFLMHCSSKKKKKKAQPLHNITTSLAVSLFPAAVTGDNTKTKTDSNWSLEDTLF